MADVTVEGSVSASTPDTAGPSLVAVNSTTLYAFYHLSSSFQYRKSTDGGATWAAGVDIITGITPAACAVWFDKWTPGNTGTVVHMIYKGGTSQGLSYNSLQTSTDTLSGIIVIATGTLLVPTSHSITLTVGGNLLVCVCANTNAGTWKSTATGASASFSSIAACHETSGADYVQLFPANLADTDDAWALFWDASADELSLKTYDDSANSWAETSIATSMVEASTANGGHTGFCGTIKHSNGHLFVAAWSELDTATAGTADLKTWDITDSGTITAKTDVLTNVFDQYGCALYYDNTNGDTYCFYLGNGSGDNYQATVSVFYKKSTDGMATWGTQTAYSEGAADDYRNVWCDKGNQSAAQGLVGAMWWDDDDNDYWFNAVNAIVTAVGGTTATIASLLDEVSAALSVNQYDQVTVGATVDELTASLNVYEASSPRIESVLDELQSLLNLNQTQQVTIASTLDELTCSISVNMAPTVTIAASVDEVTASLNVDQSTPVSLTIASTLDELQASLSVEQTDQVTIGALLDEVSAALNVNQTQQVTIGATVDELTASLSLEQRILLTIASVIDETTASLNAEQRYLLTIGATLDEATASLTLEQRILLSVVSALDELQASVNAQQSQQVTIGAMVDELTASLPIDQRILLTIASVLDEAVGSFVVSQTGLLTIASLLDELTASLDVSLLNFIFPELGKILMALDRNEALFALQGLDATETLRALARDETLFALTGYEGVETLRALDRDETLNPLEART